MKNQESLQFQTLFSMTTKLQQTTNMVQAINDDNEAFG